MTLPERGDHPRGERTVVRPFSWDEWAGLWELHRLQLAEAGIVLEHVPPRPDLSRPHEPDYHRMDRVYLRGRGGFWIAWRDGSPAGHVGGQDLGTHVELRRMYVRPEQRRHGVGQALVEALVAHCRARGVGCIRLWAGRNGAGWRLYVRCGFVEIPCDERLGPDGAPVGPDELRMERIVG